MNQSLIIVGGFAGAGKTTVSRCLATELYFPRLGADTLGRTIKQSAGVKGGQVDAYWIAYDLLMPVYPLSKCIRQSRGMFRLNLGWVLNI